MLNYLLFGWRHECEDHELQHWLGGCQATNSSNTIGGSHRLPMGKWFSDVGHQWCSHSILQYQSEKLNLLCLSRLSFPRAKSLQQLFRPCSQGTAVQIIAPRAAWPQLVAELPLNSEKRYECALLPIYLQDYKIKGIRDSEFKAIDTFEEYRFAVPSDISRAR